MRHAAKRHAAMPRIGVRWILFALLAGTIALLCVPARADAPALDAPMQQRIVALAEQLRCVVCQNQSLADSDAPLAADLRREMQEQMRAGRSDAQIADFLVQRYGDFVLYRPPLKPATALLWFAPLLLLAAALALLHRHTRAAPSGRNEEDEP